MEADASVVTHAVMADLFILLTRLASQLAGITVARATYLAMTTTLLQWGRGAGGGGFAYSRNPDSYTGGDVSPW